MVTPFKLSEMIIASQAIFDDLNIGFSLFFGSLLTQHKTGCKYYLYHHRDSQYSKNPQPKDVDS
jgi:hypothetical protein